jgi:hypothetical protein
VNKLFLVFLFPVFLVSCIEVRDANEKNKAPVQENQAGPTAEVRPLSQPHQYAVLIKNHERLMQVRRRNTEKGKLGLVEIQVSENQAEDLLNQAGSYQYDIIQGDKTFNLVVEIPQDYVISGQMNLRNLNNLPRDKVEGFYILETAGRLFFEAGSSLTTDGEKILVKVNSIESEGALVQTFPKGQTAQIGKSGRHGGHVKLQANTFRGSLHFALRGESGGTGEYPILVSKRINEFNVNGGSGGNSGLLEVDIKDKSMGSISFELSPGIGGKGVEIRNQCSGIPGCMPVILRPKGQDGSSGVIQQPIGL